MTWNEDLQRDSAKLREQWADLWYLIFRDTGFLRLTNRLGMQPKQWVIDAEARYNASKADSQ